jgi:chromosome segregation ATPase
LQVARLEGELATSVEREATLEAKIVSLQESLTESALNHQALQDERDAVIEEKTTLSQEVARFVEDAKRRDAEQKDVEQVICLQRHPINWIQIFIHVACAKHVRVGGVALDAALTSET